MMSFGVFTLLNQRMENDREWKRNQFVKLSQFF